MYRIVWTANRLFSSLNASTKKVAGLPHVYTILCNYFEVFDASAKLRKVTICIRLVCPSVRPHATTRLPLYRFSLNLIFQYFKNICWEISSLIKIGQEERLLYMKTNIHVWYLAHFFLEWKMYQTKVERKLKSHILCSITFFRKSCRLWDNV
jgi:hypothetical protein